MKKYIIAVIVIIILGIGAYFIFKGPSTSVDGTQDQNSSTNTTQSQGTTQTSKPMVVIGKSFGGRDITAYHYGTGATELLFVGGIHGGYEWNTSLVALNFMDYLKQYPEIVPANITVTVIPVLNPDGLSKVVASTTRFSAADVNPSQSVQVSGRFNGNTVDLNRNFDCDWQTNGVWQDKTVSGGTAVFSEPESQAVKAYVETNKPTAVLVWYSSAGGVFSSSCHNGVSATTTALTSAFASASGYPAYDKFNYYEITGDMVNWLAKKNIPAISVLLTNHTDPEWSKNLAGIKAFIQYFAR